MPVWARALVIVVAVIASLGTVVAVWYKTSVKPPAVTSGFNNPGSNEPVSTVDPNKTLSNTNQTQNPNGGQNNGTDGDGQNGEAAVPSRVEGVYTFLVAAKDKVGANTDAIMVAKFDANKYTLDVVSIPRDTLANVSYNNKKVNALYASGKEEGLMEGIADITGFRPDFYGIINLDAIVKIVDAVGGVDYYVPQNMDYDDPAQNLSIHFKKGLTHMTGQKAVEYMRFRKGYADADIGRIHAQHEFLTTMAQQVLENKSKVPITTIVNILVNDVNTSLTVSECTWFAKELLKMDMENVHFYTMPGNYNDYVNGKGYVTIYVEEWLEMLNENINPFDTDISVSNLDVISRNSSGKVYATSGTYQDPDWGKGASKSKANTSKSSTTTTTKPSTPSEPDEPATTKPEDPVETKPTNPENPGDTTEPTNPEDPGNTTEPTNPEDPGDTTGPTNPEDPGDTTEPTNPEDPGDTTGPTNPEDPGDTTGPTNPEEPGDTTEPTDPEDPGDTTEPTDPEDPGDTTEPTEPEEPTNPDPPPQEEDPGDGGVGG